MTATMDHVKDHVKKTGSALDADLREVFKKHGYEFVKRFARVGDGSVEFKIEATVGSATDVGKYWAHFYEPA